VKARFSELLSGKVVPRPIMKVCLSTIPAAAEAVEPLIVVPVESSSPIEGNVVIAAEIYSSNSVSMTPSALACAILCISPSSSEAAPTSITAPMLIEAAARPRLVLYCTKASRNVFAPA
jgi:hypothetical protein